MIIFRLMTKRIFLFFVCLALCGGSGLEVRAQGVVPQSREQVLLSFAPLVRQVTPAVVNIYTKKMVRQRLSPLFDDPFFRQFLGDAVPQGMTRKRLEQSLGSGVIIRSDGMIVTSRHVIADADEIRVVLSDRREFDAKVVIADEKSDLAVLRLEAQETGFPFLRLKDSDEVFVGDLVLAIGNPFGVGQTVTSGIVSALTHKAIGAGDLGHFIQTDAAINPGNSGGALVTMDGFLIGINASIYSRSGGNMGIGFAVPSNMVRLLLNAAVRGQTRLAYPWTGISGQEVSQDIAASLGLAQPVGVLVKSLHSASPAIKGGLKTGDVIISVDGREILNPEDFRYRVNSLAVGAVVEFVAMRNGQRRILRIQMISAPESPPRNETLVSGRNPVAGARIANISPAVADEMGLQGIEKGVVVVSVTSGTLAARVGLSARDILLEINDRTVSDVAQALGFLEGASRGWRLKIRRGGNEVTMFLGG